MSNNNTERKTIADFPELIKEWHPTKNGELKPEEVTSGSNKKVWWKCEKGLEHEWQTTVNSRTKHKTKSDIYLKKNI